MSAKFKRYAMAVPSTASTTTATIGSQPIDVPTACAIPAGAARTAEIAVDASATTSG